MKRPEEIKKGLECCIGDDEGVVCEECAYCSEIRCVSKMAADALAYIQQLENRERDLFGLLSSAWYGKGCYFKQEDGTVYSRVSGEYMSFDQAIDEFAHELTVEGESLAKDMLRNAPTIDAEPVVRCKECRISEDAPIGEGHLYCNHTCMVVSENDYCSFGERKMDEEEE